VDSTLTSQHCVNTALCKGGMLLGEELRNSVVVLQNGIEIA